MYIRWKRRATYHQAHTGTYQWKRGRTGKQHIAAVRERRPTGDYILSAQLVECHRVDGKPRQKVIKYLGTISERGIEHIGHRVHFWRHVGAALKTLDLAPEQQHIIEQALHARVPFPAKEEVDAWRAEFLQLEARIRQSVRR